MLGIRRLHPEELLSEICGTVHDLKSPIYIICKHIDGVRKADNTKGVTRYDNAMDEIEYYSLQHKKIHSAAWRDQLSMCFLETKGIVCALFVEPRTSRMLFRCQR